MTTKTTIGVLVAALLLAGGGYWFMTERTARSTGSDLFYSEDTKATPPAEEEPSTNQTGTMQATLHTSKGDIVIELFSDKAPNTVANFAKLAGEGFYNDTKFHRVIKDFMNQAGDPLTRDDSKMAQWGTGGPGYRFDDELYAGNHNALGTISMANAGPDTNGSQFFINARDNSFLDTKHVVFGRVVEGLEVVTAINNVQTDGRDRPVEPIILKSVTIN